MRRKTATKKFANFTNINHYFGFYFQFTRFQRECLASHNVYRARHGAVSLKLNTKVERREGWCAGGGDVVLCSCAGWRRTGRSTWWPLPGWSTARPQTSGKTSSPAGAPRPAARLVGRPWTAGTARQTTDISLNASANIFGKRFCSMRRQAAASHSVHGHLSGYLFIWLSPRSSSSSSVLRQWRAGLVTSVR